MHLTQKQKKWNEAYTDADIASATPALILKENSYLLSNHGTALDLACGRAGNAIFLAKHGYQVDAIDNSEVVLSHVQRYSESKKLDINCISRDIEEQGIDDKQYDVIVVSYFLSRKIINQIIQALKPDGLLFYQTWSQLSCDDKGPSNPNFRLEAEELLSLFKPLRPIFYRENGLVGNLNEGLRNEAMLVAQRI